MSEFWSDLAWALIDNDFIDEEIETIAPARQRRRQVEHKLVSALVKAKKWDGCKWIKSSKQLYPQQWCTVDQCRNPIHTYCVCDVGKWLCADHFTKHVIDQNT